MKIRKLAAVIAAAVTVLSAAGTVYGYEYDNNFSFEECTSESDCIVLASYIGKSGSEYKFKNVRMLKGSADSSIIYVTAPDDFAEKLEKDSKYVLYLDKSVSVYFKHDMYTVISDIFIAADERNNITEMSALGLDIANPPETVTSLTHYVDSVLSQSDDSVIEGTDYIRKANTKQLIELSPVIVKAEIGERIGDNYSGSGVYSCTVAEQYKGDIPVEFTAVLFDSKVTEGGEYYLLLNDDTEDGNYILTSKKSIVSADNAGFETKLAANS